MGYKMKGFSGFGNSPAKQKNKKEEYPTKEDNERTCEGKQTIGDCYRHLVKNHKDLYEDILESKFDKLKDWMKQRDGISYDEKTKKLYAEDDKIMQEGDILKEYKTPKEYQQGKFKLYLRDDDNLNLVILNCPSPLLYQVDTSHLYLLFLALQRPCYPSIYPTLRKPH